MPTLAELQLAFLNSLKQDSPRRGGTVAGYGRALGRFVSWLQKAAATREVTPEHLTAERLVSFGRWLKAWQQPSGAVLSAAAQNYHLSALRSFLAYLKGKGETTLSALHLTLVKAPRPEVAVLSSAEMSRLLKAPLLTTEHPLVQLRDRALLELLISTGLKTAEAAGLRRSNLRDGGGSLTLVKPKHQPRVVTLSHQARHHLERYLTERNDTDEALFVRHDRAGRRATGALTPRSLQRVLEHYRTVAKITKRLTPGSLRHTFAARLLEEGTDHQIVSGLLGHAHASTLKLYHYQHLQP